MEEAKCSTELYAKIQACIDEIDARFFSGAGKQKIPELVFAINDSCKACVTAYVSPNALYDKKTNTRLQYMGLNSRHFDRDLSEILTTLCHELCHVYENAYIHIPRGGYHDREWGKLMLQCGLEPIYMNKSKTAVSTKVTEDGVFKKFVDDFKKAHGEDYFNIVEYTWEIEHKAKIALGIEDAEDGDGEAPKADNVDKPVKKYNRNKIKYTCPDCGAKVWGKAGLNIECVDCACSFEEEEHEEEHEEDSDDFKYLPF